MRVFLFADVDVLRHVINLNQSVVVFKCNAWFLGSCVENLTLQRHDTIHPSLVTSVHPCHFHVRSCFQAFLGYAYILKFKFLDSHCISGPEEN